jgi:AcrR family transcriptional regulator
MLEEIKQIGRRHLAIEGSAGLSLRAVARDMGMVSSAIYRYVPSRDELLTILIEDAYNAVGEVAEQADQGCRRSDLRGRFLAVSRAVRAWALAHPAEYGLVYGSPVPGYKAPPERTVLPAQRVTALLVQILIDGLESGAIEADGSHVPAKVRRDLAALRRSQGFSIPDDVLARGLVAWPHIFGVISFELFGHTHALITDHDAFFDMQIERMIDLIGLDLR